MSNAAVEQQQQQQQQQQQLKPSTTEKRNAERPARPHRKKNKQSEHVKNKVVVRRLPPTLPKEIFLKSLEPFNDDFTLFYYVPGEPSLGDIGCSRAYLLFKTLEGIVRFSAMYNGHVFRNAKGVEHQAVVEYAPYQRSIMKPFKKNSKASTIESDPVYIKFIEDLHAAPPLLASAEVQYQEALRAAELAPKSTEEKTTPLLEHFHALYKEEKSRGRSGGKKKIESNFLFNEKSSLKGGSEKKKNNKKNKKVVIVEKKAKKLSNRTKASEPDMSVTIVTNTTASGEVIPSGRRWEKA